MPLKNLLILGMHRSGTSCLTGSLQQLGLNLGNVSESDPYNLKGNRENRSISLFNESLLKYSGGGWSNIPTKIIWENKHVLEQNLLLDEFFKLEEPRGLKDPRMLFLLPFWIKKLKDIDFIGTFRHPYAVAKSLYSRKSFSIPIDEGLELWYHYNNQLLKLHNQYQFNLLNFDLPEDQYKRTLILFAGKLGLSTDSKKLSFFEKKLKQQTAEQDLSNIQIPDKIMLLYKKLEDISLQLF
jgi:hypothetical protein